MTCKTIFEIGDFEVTFDPKTGAYEVWDAVSKRGLFYSEEHARQWAEAYAADAWLRAAGVR